MEVIDNNYSSEEKTWAMLCHLAGLLYFIPFAQILGPLIIWSIKKGESEFIDDQGKEAINFQISMLIYILCCIPLIIFVIGIPLMIMLGILDLVFTIIAGVNAGNGTKYQYPLSLKLIK